MWVASLRHGEEGRGNFERTSTSLPRITVLLTLLSSMKHLSTLLSLLSIATLLIGCGGPRRLERADLGTPTIPLTNGEPRIEGAWHLTITTESLGSLETVMNVEVAGDGGIEGHSRPGALADVVGGWKSFWARTLSRGYEEGAFLHLYAYATAHHGDTLDLQGELVTPLGTFALDAQCSRDVLHGSMSTEGESAAIEGTRFTGTLPLRNYPALTALVRDTLQRHIYNPALLNEPVWRSFWEHLTTALGRAQDDIDAIFLFTRTSAEVGISHFDLHRTMTHTLPSAQPGASPSTTSAAPPQVEVKLLPSGAAYMRIRHFGGGIGSIDSGFALLQGMPSRGLILDLRSNPGGDFSSMRVASHLFDTALYAGSLLGQQWWASHSQPPTPEESRTMPSLSEYDWQAFVEMLQRYGTVIGKVEPAAPIFKGGVYVLIDGSTASAAEPLVALLKERGRATIVGETTAGYMLSSEEFDLPGGWRLRLPSADYYTTNGERIEGRGVTPDVPCDPVKALEEAVRLSSR